MTNRTMESVCKHCRLRGKSEGECLYSSDINTKDGIVGICKFKLTDRETEESMAKDLNDFITEEFKAIGIDDLLNTKKLVSVEIILDTDKYQNLLSKYLDRDYVSGRFTANVKLNHTGLTLKHYFDNMIVDGNGYYVLPKECRDASIALIDLLMACHNQKTNRPNITYYQLPKDEDGNIIKFEGDK